jgi:phosphoribosylaminoimidazole-succinocarboxamide synthase
MEVSPLIQLLVSPETVTDDHVASICQELEERFGLTRVLVRSLQAVSLEALGTPSEVSLIVLLSNDVASIECFQEQSVSPVVAMRAGRSAPVLALQIAKFCAVGSSAAGADLKAKIQKAVLLQRQVQSVQDAQYKTKSPFYSQKIQARLAATMTGDAVAVEGRQRGKVRDRYSRGNQVALVTTDRQSGFDRQLAQIPYKGAVLNLTSAFWFVQTKDIIKNHVVAVPHPYVTVGRKCQPFPIEFVVRSYMTGSTGTSIWKNYQDGVRNYCGHLLPDGMHKNQKLVANLLTPTTKEEAHDRPISLADILTEKWMTAEDLDVCAKAALEVFALGQKIAAQRGLILVDTKYEFGLDEETGEILLIDEVHTPDSSRYWLASSYEERIAAGQEPENIDKEFLRLWFRERCDPYKDAVIPDAPPDLVAELSRRYILLYELITDESFDFDAVTDEAAITEAVKAHL